MPVRYKPVSERALDALVTQLETITRANGYNTDVMRVERLRQRPTQPAEPRAIQVFPLAAEEGVWCSAKMYQTKEVEIWFYSNRTENLDTEYNLFRSDIFRCLARDIEDPSHPTPSVTQIYLELMTDVPLFMDASDPFVAGMMRYKITYAHCLDDDRKWDESDNLVEVVE